MAIKAFAYGAVKPRTKADQDLFDGEVGRMHDLYNSLIEVKRNRRRETSEALAAAVPGLAEAECLLTQRDKELAIATAVVNEHRRQARSRAARHVPEVDRVRLQEARRLRNEARNHYRQLRRVGFVPGGPGREAVDAVNERARLEVNARCQRSGVFWPNKTAVRDSVDRADEMSGAEPPEFKRRQRFELGVYTGVDRHLAVGDINVRADPEGGRPQSGLTLQELIDGGSEYVRLEPEASPARWVKGGRRHRRKRWFVLHLRVGSDERRRPVWFRLPFTIDNWDTFPTDALIRRVLVTRRRRGLDMIWGVRFIVWYPDREKAAHLDDRCVGVDVGWRLLESGDLRVAFWRGRDGRSGQWVIPAGQLWRFDLGDRLQSEIDTRFNEYLPRLIEWRNATRPDGRLGEFLSHAGLWKSAGRVYQLHRLFEETGLFEGHPIRVATADMAEFWHRRYQHKCHGTAKGTDWRKCYYYCLIKGLKGLGYTTVVIEDVHWPEFYRRPDTADDSPVLRGPRKYMRIASPGLLHQMLGQKFDSCIAVAPEYTTLTCHACGTVNEGWDPAVELVHTCSNPDCGVVWDQDENAAINLISLAVQDATASEERPRDDLPAPPSGRRNRRRPRTEPESGAPELG